MNSLQIRALDASRPKSDLTVVTDNERRGELQPFKLLVNSTFNIESISIFTSDGGTPIHVTKVTLDHIEVAVHKDDSCGVPNTKQPESSWWHPVSAAICQS